MTARISRHAAVGVILLLAASALLHAQERASARTWVGREAELETYLKTAKATRVDDIGTGVTRPKKVTLAPGGPVGFMAWKPIRPGRYAGYLESYKNEIAAYELDKFLGLGMIPPTVERELNGEMGAAVMWASPTQSFKDLGGVPGQKDVKGPPAALVAPWTRQITKAKMFDNLIANIDPNLGNWLVDPEWNLILIDHTRAFTTTRNLYHQLVTVDPELWKKMKALDEPTLTTAIGAWVDKNAIKGILERRDKMQLVVDKLTR